MNKPKALSTAPSKHLWMNTRQSESKLAQLQNYLVTLLISWYYFVRHNIERIIMFSRESGRKPNIDPWWWLTQSIWLTRTVPGRNPPCDVVQHSCYHILKSEHYMYCTVNICTFHKKFCERLSNTRRASVEWQDSTAQAALQSKAERSIWCWPHTLIWSTPTLFPCGSFYEHQSVPLSERLTLYVFWPLLHTRSHIHVGRASILGPMTGVFYQ